MKLISLFLIVLFSVAATFENCTFKGKKLYGNVRVVSSGETFQVRVVEFGENLQVKITDHPYSCGEWRFVTSGEDFTVRFVTFGEDFSIRIIP